MNPAIKKMIFHALAAAVITGMAAYQNGHPWGWCLAGAIASAAKDAYAFWSDSPKQTAPTESEG